MSQIPDRRQINPTCCQTGESPFIGSDRSTQNLQYLDFSRVVYCHEIGERPTDFHTYAHD